MNPVDPLGLVTDEVLHLLDEGRLLELQDHLGAHPVVVDGAVAGVQFAVWAPAAEQVTVAGDWNFWDRATTPLTRVGTSGVWCGFSPDARVGHRYKFAVTEADGGTVLRADPLARASEVPPDTASIIHHSTFVWSDQSWVRRQAEADPWREPMSIYEVHLGSWRRDGDRELTFRELAPELVAYVTELGFTHVELLPVMGHPFAGSWGYQVTSYFAPAARWGDPDDLRFLIDHCHAHGVGVILDWVPGHFPRDEWALALFDGTALYEHPDPRRGDQPDWGTKVFDFGRGGVRSFLLSNARFWLREFHADGLRVDAVASMLYLDYSRPDGAWLPNEHGGREHLEAVSLLQELTTSLGADFPHAPIFAEESTAWPGVSRPVADGGLGFGFKWNLGWMHDTLSYLVHDPVHRSHHHDELTFSLHYAFSENFVLPLSHDEVVHGKGSLLRKLPGDRWRRFATLRALYGWMWAHPGKQLLFMGGELAQEREWSHERALDWDLLADPDHAGVQQLICDLNRTYRQHPALWSEDFAPAGFSWLMAEDAAANVAAFERIGTGGERVVCLSNFSAVPHERYRLPLPVAGPWRELLNTDVSFYGGSGLGNLGHLEAHEDPDGTHPAFAEVVLPPLATLWLTPG